MMGRVDEPGSSGSLTKTGIVSRFATDTRIGTFGGDGWEPLLPTIT